MTTWSWDKRPPNWLGDQNPWLMPTPPAWWLRRLWDRDDQLRVLPGLTQPCYRIARVSRVMRAIAPALGNDSETGRMCREGVVPVVTLKPGVTWNHDFFAWLDAGDLWAIPNAPEHVEALEQQAEEKRDAAATDELDQRSVSAHDALKWRTGQQVIVQAPEPVDDNNKQPGSPSHAAPGQVISNGSHT
jgi:hypothetical protein